MISGSACTTHDNCTDMQNSMLDTNVCVVPHLGMELVPLGFVFFSPVIYCLPSLHFSNCSLIVQKIQQDLSALWHHKIIHHLRNIKSFTLETQLIYWSLYLCLNMNQGLAGCHCNFPPYCWSSYSRFLFKNPLSEIWMLSLPDMYPWLVLSWKVILLLLMLV